MRARVRKWGNSLSLRIPKAAADETGLAQGSEVDLKVERGKLIVRPMAPKVYRLADLLKGVRKSNLHGELDFGPPVGRELL